jgi:hypothetical protein
MERRMLEAPDMSLPDFSVPFNIETYASKRGLGVVIMQSRHAVSYLSKVLGPIDQTHSVYI